MARTLWPMNSRIILALILWLICQAGYAQAFELRKQHDSLYSLNDWRLPYPVYQFQTGDVDGDGKEDAMVGVIKSTRFYPVVGRRLFVFKNYEGLVRPMWLGSKLGGKLCDFRFCNGLVRGLESNAKGEYSVAEYRWSGFGFAFERYLIRNVDEVKARETFEN